jgi:hypothetical protein
VPIRRPAEQQSDAAEAEAGDAPGDTYRDQIPQDGFHLGDFFSVGDRRLANIAAAAS